MGNTTKKDYEITPMNQVEVRCFGKEGQGIITRMKFSDDGFEWNHHLGPRGEGFYAEDALYSCKITWQEFNQVMRDAIKDGKFKNCR